MSARSVGRRRAAEAPVASPARGATAMRGAARTPAPAGAVAVPGASSTVWQWQPSEHTGLLTYHDGNKRWYHCRECQYFNDRLYHCKMHYERIHVKEGKAMARKRKYPSSDLPEMIPQPDIVPHAVDNSPRRSVSGTPQHRVKTAVDSHTPNTLASAAQTPLNMIGGIGIEHPSPSPSTDSRSSKTTPPVGKPQVRAGRRTSPFQAGRKATAGGLAALDATDVWDGRNSLVLKFGEGVFFSDTSVGPGLSIDVAKLHRPPGAPVKASPTARTAKGPSAKKAATPRKKKEVGATKGSVGRGRLHAHAGVVAGALDPGSLDHVGDNGALIPRSPPREHSIGLAQTPTQSPHRLPINRSAPGTPDFGNMYTLGVSSEYMLPMGASPVSRSFRNGVPSSREGLLSTPDISRMALPSNLFGHGVLSCGDMQMAQRAPAQSRLHGGGRAGRAEPKSALGASPLSSPVRQNIFLNLNSVPATPVNPGRVLGRREGSADIFGSLKSPLMDRGMESFALHGSGLGSSDFLMCTEDLN
jgi:hypothetical protein